MFINQLTTPLKIMRRRGAGGINIFPKIGRKNCDVSRQLIADWSIYATDGTNKNLTYSDITIPLTQIILYPYKCYFCLGDP